jgi:hypothetical protein
MFNKLQPIKPLNLPQVKPIKTDSVSSGGSQSLKEWAMAGGGVPEAYKGREHVWHKKAEKFAAGGEVYNTVPDMSDGGEIIDGPAFKKGGKAKSKDPLDEFSPPRYRSAGRRKESSNDREAAKNVPVDLARGFVAGTLGMPGDIESLVRMLPGLDEKTVLPTSEDILKRIPFGSDTPASRAASGLGILGGGFYTGPGSAARAITAVPKAVKRAGQDFAQSISPVNVIKPKGGNWLGGRLMGNMDENVTRLRPYKKAGDDGTFLQKDLDRATQRLQMLEADPYKMESMVSGQRQNIEDVKKKMALNDWVESNLKKYVKTQMGTPEDPLRMFFDRRAMEIEEAYAKDIKRADRAAQRAADEADPRRKANLERESERIRIEASADRDFAREHITHVPGRLEDYSPEADYSLKARRQEAGFPAEGLGQSEMAKRWETLTDDAIVNFRAGDAQDALAAGKKAEEFKAFADDYNNDLKKRFDEHVRSKGFKDSEIRAFDTLPINKKAEILDDPRYEAIRAEYQDLVMASDSNMRSAAVENPFVSKLDPETQLYSGNTADMGFDHVIDILKQDVMSGRIRPEQLNKVSIEDAVRRTADFDQEQARAMAAATIKATEGMPTYKDYPEKGYKWIELAPPTYTPETLPSGFKLEQWEYKGKPAWSVVDEAGTTYNDAASSPDEAMRKFAKSKEGSKALEDALKYEGDTMGHCVGGYCDDVLEGRSRIFSLRDRKGEPHVTVEVEPNQHLDYNKWYEQQPTSYKALLNAKKSEKGYDPYQEPAYLAAREAVPPKITQIKGKQNEAPKEQYLPYVQDFVKSDNWSEVGDLRNTGLVRYKGKIMTQGEADDLLYKELNESSPGLTNELGLTSPPTLDEGFAKGGKVVKEAVELGINEIKALLGMAKEAPKDVEPIVVKPAERAAAGRKAAELIKSQPQVKASEALGQAMEKGFKKTTTTQADRTRVGGGNIGGAPFSAISEADPAYAGKVWGVMDEGTASRLKNLTDPETAWTTMLGSANQLKTNPIVFDKLRKGFLESMKAGNLTPELEAKINHNLALTFGEGAQIRDPKIWKEADTFEKRAALADLMMGKGIPPKKGGVSLGGEKSGKGVIFRPTDILKRETEPGLLHPEHGGSAPTFSAGPRLFSMDPVSEFRPDLHPGFPTLISGKDLGVNMMPTPTEVYLPDWHRRFKQANPERYPPFKTEKQAGPGYYDLALGVEGEGLPSQKLNDEYIRHLLREGYKAGGRVGGLTAATNTRT